MRRLALTLLIPLVAAPAATAKRTVLGSSLRAEANQTLAQGADTAYWPQRIRGGRAFRAPRSGQVLSVRVKGRAIKPAGAPDPLTLIHFQSLTPAGAGDMRVMLSSQGFSMPFGGSAQQVTTFEPENLCIRKGGVLAFNTVGGFAPPFYPRGVPFRIFSRRDGSRTARHTADNGTNNGDRLRDRPRRDSELLMQYVLGTGRHLGDACRAYLRG